MTEFEPLYSKIKNHLDLSDEETAFFVSHFAKKKVKKRQFIVQPDYIAKHRNYVVNGAFRSYVIGNDGQEHTLNLAIDDWWITDSNSFIYQKPATMFVADFIGSPPMSFLHFEGSVLENSKTVELSGQTIEVPMQRESAQGKLVFGVRPEHVKLSDQSAFRGEILATEYLGTSQILTIKTLNGDLKARISSAKRVNVGEIVGLTFNEKSITLFNEVSGAAIHSDLNLGSI